MNKSMPRYLLFDRSRLELRPLAERGHDMTIEQLLPLARPQSAFPHPEFDELMQANVAARLHDRPVVIMLGGHPIKLGLLRRLRLIVRDCLVLADWMLGRRGSLGRHIKDGRWIAARCSRVM